MRLQPNHESLVNQSCVWLPSPTCVNASNLLPITIADQGQRLDPTCSNNSNSSKMLPCEQHATTCLHEQALTCDASARIQIQQQQVRHAEAVGGSSPTWIAVMDECVSNSTRCFNRWRTVCLIRKRRGCFRFSHHTTNAISQDPNKRANGRAPSSFPLAPSAPHLLLRTHVYRQPSCCSARASHCWHSVSPPSQRPSQRPGLQGTVTFFRLQREELRDDTSAASSLIVWF